jgi:anthranilate/para-aminobenzoate synthase component II
VFAGLASPVTATRYHSLCVAHAPFPAELRANAASDDGVLQGIAHRTLPVHGVQFHPESVLTACGAEIFGNFLAMVRP